MNEQTSNLNLYNNVRPVPKEALRDIQAGRLKGKSDINPMWRLKTLTEQFGVCGFGWKYTITKQWLENGGNNEQSAFVNIELFIKLEGEWSEAIPGTGGSSFVANEKNGLYTSDECFKMALTDAISVACKALGFGADVYWNADATKYNKPEVIHPQTNTSKLSDAQVNRAFAIAKGKGYSSETVKKWVIDKYQKTDISDLTKSQYDEFTTGLNNMKEKGAA